MLWLIVKHGIQNQRINRLYGFSNMLDCCFTGMDDGSEDDTFYLRKMNAILCSYPCHGRPQKPSQILPHVYIGNQENARNLRLLRSLGITHILNCAALVSNGSPFHDNDSYYPTDSGIKRYREFAARDNEDYNMMKHFQHAKDFLDQVKGIGGKALVHCSLGVNRSGAICVAYVMIDQSLPLLQAVKKTKRMRTMLLTNKGFRRQLVKFARTQNLLDSLDIDVTEL